jgi:hypothetical protein
MSPLALTSKRSRRSATTTNALYSLRKVDYLVLTDGRNRTVHRAELKITDLRDDRRSIKLNCSLVADFMAASFLSRSRSAHSQ